MLSLLLGLILFLVGITGPFLYDPSLGLAVFASFTFITPMQLGITSLRGPLVVAITTMVGYFVSAKYTKKFSVFPVEVILFCVMLMGMFFGALNAFDSALAFENFYIYCKYAVFMWLLVNILDSLRRVEIFNNSLIIGAAWLVYKCWDLRGTTAGRFENINGGIVGDANHFAAALVLLLPLVLVRMFRDSRFIVRIGAALGVFGMLMSVIISTSRGAFLGVVVMAFAFLFIFKNYRKKIIVAIFVAVVVTSPFVASYYFERMSSITVSEDESRDASSESRLRFWGLAFDVWQRNPVYGCGLRNFIYYNGYENEGKQWGEPGHVAHSLWFEALAEGGLLVFVPLLWMLALFFRRIARAKRKFLDTPRVYADLVALQVGMIGFLVCASFINRLIFEPLYWYCGLAYVYDRGIESLGEVK